MPTHLPFVQRVRAQLRSRDWFGVGIELLTVVLGVVLGVQASQWAAEREERAYRQQIISALGGTLNEFSTHGRDIGVEMMTRVGQFERARAAGQRPPPPVYREPGGERPPTRAWDAIVATGAARSIEPQLFLRLAMFFNRADSFGERYIRYNQFSEVQVLPHLSTPTHFYSSEGTLRPEFAAYIDRLRDLAETTDGMAGEADQLQRDLERSL